MAAAWRRHLRRQRGRLRRRERQRGHRHVFRRRALVWRHSRSHRDRHLCSGQRRQQRIGQCQRARGQRRHGRHVGRPWRRHLLCRQRGRLRRRERQRRLRHRVRDEQLCSERQCGAALARKRDRHPGDGQRRPDQRDLGQRRCSNNVLDGGGGTQNLMGAALATTPIMSTAADDVITENFNERHPTPCSRRAAIRWAPMWSGSRSQPGPASRRRATPATTGSGATHSTTCLTAERGTDTADYSSATQAVVVDLPGHIAIGAQIGTDTLSSIENVKTGSGNDAVAGDGATNVLDGGAGIDTVSYYAVSSGVVLDLAAQIGVDGTSTDTLLNFENANGTALQRRHLRHRGRQRAQWPRRHRHDQLLSLHPGRVDRSRRQRGDTRWHHRHHPQLRECHGSASTTHLRQRGANVLDGLGGIDTLSYYVAAGLYRPCLNGGRGRSPTSCAISRSNATNQNDTSPAMPPPTCSTASVAPIRSATTPRRKAVTINLSAGTGVSGGVTDTLLNFENANGSAYADNITGNGGANVLNGLGGADTLTGGGGFDTFEFRAGQANGDVDHRLHRQWRGSRRHDQARRLRHRRPGRDVYATQRHAVADPFRARRAQRDHHVEQRSCRSRERFLLRVSRAAALVAGGTSGPSWFETALARPPHHEAGPTSCDKLTRRPRPA